MTDLNLTHCFQCAEEAILTVCFSCGGWYCPNHARFEWHFCHAVDFDRLAEVAGAIK
jgi:hypothetical protein